ncbi:MAG: hypothetical protein E7262_04710 [Lachnospiraceae bacterium]|nr:hypothetical protein [Lachnospiraceae bacterium]
MKGNVKSCLVVFLVAMLVMQVVFNDAGRAGAAHSATGTIKHVSGVRVIIEAGTDKVSPCYCISRTLYCQDNDSVTSDMNIDSTKSFLLNAAFLYGFHKNTTESQITSADYSQWNKTQQVVWAIMEDKFKGTLDTCSVSGCDAAMLKKIAYLNQVPSYVTDQENVMKWNTCSNKFELTLTNTAIEGSYSANAGLQVDTTSLPAGCTATVEGENIKLESTEEFTDVKAIKLFKRPEGKGLVVAWDNGNGTKQPQITLDYDEDPIAKVMDLKVKTEAKPVVATPEPTPEPTVQPECQPSVLPEVQEPEVQPEVQEPTCPQDQGCQQEPVEEEQKVEIKENTMADAEEQLDDVPKTADSSNLQLVYQLLAASALTMVWLGTITVIKRRRENI